MSIDLSTRYLGMDLKNPLVVSACPLTGEIETLRQLEEAGAAAAVLPSLFEEQIEHLDAEIGRLYSYRVESSPESLSYFPEMGQYNTGPDRYMLNLQRMKSQVSVPIIASLNGSTAGGWTRYARMLQDAGASALELNIYIVPTDSGVTGQEVEQAYVDLVAAVREVISIPLSVKLGPYFSAPVDIAQRLIAAGADGLVLFNRYLEPDIDLETLDVVPHLVLSSRNEMRLPLRWIAILRDHISASLAATSGIHEHEDVVKVLLAGADVAMLATALLQHGPDHLTYVLKQLQHWMTDREYQSVTQLKGSVSQTNCADPTAYERSNYTRALVSYSGKGI